MGTDQLDDGFRIRWSNVSEDDTQDFLILVAEGGGTIRCGWETQIPKSNVCGISDGLESVGVRAYSRLHKGSKSRAMMLFCMHDLKPKWRKKLFDLVEETV